MGFVLAYNFWTFKKETIEQYLVFPFIFNTATFVYAILPGND